MFIADKKEDPVIIEQLVEVLQPKQRQRKL